MWLAIILFSKETFYLREKWFFDVDLFTSKVTLEKKNNFNVVTQQ